MSDAVRPLTDVTERLDAAADRRSLSDALDQLAALARHDIDARQRLLVEISERKLVERSVSGIFFDASLVDDAVQETIIAVANGIAGFRGEAAFLTWLDRVARNAARRIRNRQLRSPSPLGDLDDLDSAGSARTSALRLSSLVADEQVLADALARLPPEYRQVLLLREVDDMSYAAIAARLDVPMNTVRTRLRRARLRLAELLVEHQTSG